VGVLSIAKVELANVVELIDDRLSHVAEPVANRNQADGPNAAR